MNNSAPLPSLGNSLGLAMVGGAGFGALSRLGELVPGPQSLTTKAMSSWAASTDLADIAITLIRLVGLGLSIYLIVIGVVGAIAIGTRWRPAHRLWRLITTTGTRQMIAGGLALAVSVPVATSAHAPSAAILSDIGPSAAIALTDLGAVAEITDIGAAPVQEPRLAAAAPEPAAAELSEPTADVWLVARGDHLWSIAQETLADEWGRPPREPEVEAYWRRLIDINRSQVGANPDLLFPGQTLTLPPVD